MPDFVSRLVWLAVFVLGSTTALWWESPTTTWTPVSPNWSWEKRRTGVQPTWKAGLGHWSHYEASALSSAARHPIPWTSGYMLKFLREINATAFQLHSVYEPAAKGLWLKGGMTQRAKDGLFEHEYTFQQTPYRITTFTGTSSDNDGTDVADAARTTIVQEDACTFSGVRKIPTIDEANALLESPRPRFQFAELWLAEKVHDKPEGRKIGLFCQYDGVTGELTQVFRMREVALPDDLDVASPHDAIDLNAIVTDLTHRPFGPFVDRDYLNSDEAKALLMDAVPIQQIVDNGPWKRVVGRAVRTLQGAQGPEDACPIDCVASDVVFYVPGDSSLFYECRFDDGVYLRIPKSLHPNMWTDDAPVSLELGCFMLNGDFHRLLAVGTRAEGGLQHVVYERWCR